MFRIMKSVTIKKIIYEICFTFAFLILLLVIYFIWERNRDPLSAINMVDLNTAHINENIVFDSLLAGERYYSDVQLLSLQTDTIKALISFPPDYQKRSFPVVTILGGLRIARENFRFIKNPGQNIIVIYIYPYQAEQWDKGFILREIPRVRRAILKTPAQIVELHHWLQKQSWADTSKVSLLGYSFGALFLPAVERISETNNVETGPCILAYGGADFNFLLSENLKVKPKWLRPYIAWISSSMIYTVDPIHYAPKMQGEFYLINGLKDKQIPKESWKLLHEMIPEPVKVDILNEGHMHPRKPQLTQKLVDMSRKWLAEQGILN